MQRNPYWPLKGPSFFSTTEIPPSCISLTVQIARSASGPNFAARMASRRNFPNMLDPKLAVRLEASFRRAFFDLVGTSQDLDAHEPLLR
jgi:hypothetical protein